MFRKRQKELARLSTLSNEKFHGEIFATDGDSFEPIQTFLSSSRMQNVELNKNAEIDKKKIAKFESEVEEARMTIEQLITTNESENREFSQKIKILEEKLKNEEEKNRAGNQEKIQQSAIQERNKELEKIKKELGEKGGAGHVFGKIDRRNMFIEEKVRRILRGLEAGLTEVNFLERIRIVFYFLFFVSTRFSSKTKVSLASKLGSARRRLVLATTIERLKKRRRRKL
ncbi:unnamed protein product [Oikopleura dioica]|uniref:Uncharacterized protein n=1 Tax=Oikopleura dioica TaxID=34765 RepID=E4YPK2_OIKDI|nr:unnamed protein product [Oikopleura dioica]